MQSFACKETGRLGARQSCYGQLDDKPLNGGQPGTGPLNAVPLESKPLDAGAGAPEVKVSEPKRRDLSERSAEHPCVQAFANEFNYLLRTLRRLGVHENDVEDLAHEVFLVLFQGWERYDPERPLRAYLFGIAFRVASNHRRKYKREVTYAVVEPDDVEPGPDRVFEAQETRDLLLMALEKLPMSRRAVLIMHDIDEMPMTEIASALSIYRFTGYSRLRKARQELAAAVKAVRAKGGR